MTTTIEPPPQTDSGGDRRPAEPSSPEARTGTLAGILTPVQPARPTAHLGTTAALAQDLPAAEAATPGGVAGRGKTGSGDRRDGPIGALVRALAGRLGRTGTATSVKQSHDIKETRLSGNSTSATHANKSDRTAKHESGSQHRSNRDAKIADLNNKVHQHHNRNQQDHKRASTSDAKTSHARQAKDDNSSRHNRDSKDNRDAKASDAKSSKNDNASKSAQDDKNHRDARTDGKTAKTNSTDTKSSDTKTTSAKKDDAARNDNSQRSNQDDRKTGSTDTKNTRTDVPAYSARDAGPFDSAPTKRPKGGGPDERGSAKNPARKIDLGKTSDAPSDPAKEAGPDRPAKKDTEPADRDKQDQASQGPRPRTQTSREVGYRDGTRAAAAVGHVRAWRDGTRDGWDDRTTADLAERKKMDATKTRNEDRRLLKPDKAPIAPKTAPAAGSTADMTKTTEPPKQPTLTIPPKPTTPPRPTVPPKPTVPPTIPAGTGAQKKTAPAPGAVTTKTTAATPHSGQTTGPTPPGPKSPTAPEPTAVTAVKVGPDAVEFTAPDRHGVAAQHTLSRGEVRSLRQFEQRLEQKGQTLAKIGEDNKTAQQHALAHAMRAQQLAEAAKEMQGGMALVGVLLRLAEWATALRYKTDEVAKRTTRSAEAVRVVAANAQTRHGVIYKAVADSPLTTPAERAFYQDKQGS
ncbi:hypothetical protein [Kitasatospora kifunensis]|uniref:Uncharacterized protein n=1 Tax=Kitasatospora kifunensis TaxID=58351 RepID=A0A7W7QYP9_KITKI|nr:hypothetical protein [Kitasatospora kifunensis]MBB4922247.1 hypothetical protein [Kitasatospora kifunensis]